MISTLGRSDSPGTQPCGLPGRKEAVAGQVPGEKEGQCASGVETGKENPDPCYYSGEQEFRGREKPLDAHLMFVPTLQSHRKMLEVKCGVARFQEAEEDVTVLDEPRVSTSLASNSRK